MSKRTVITAMVTSAALLAACGGGPADEEVTTLTFSTWQAEEPGYREFWQEAKAQFEAEHEGVTLEIRQTAFADYQQTITTQLAAGESADVIHLPTRFFPAFADEGFLADISDRVDATDIPTAWPEAQNLMEWDEATQGVLIQNYGYVMYYNEAMLEEAGLEVPGTWEEFVDAAEQLTTGDVFGVAMETRQGPNIVLELSWPAVGTGVPYLADGNYNLTSPEMVQLAEQVRELAGYAPQGVSSEQKRQYFADGSAAMMFDGPFVGSLLEDAPEELRDHFRVAPMPFETVPGAMSSSVHIPERAEGARLDLAWEFIELLTTEEMQDYFVEAVGNPAPREGAGAEAAEDNPDLQVFTEVTADAIDVVPDDPRIRLRYAEFTDVVGSGVSELMSTNRSTEEILAGVQSQLESAIPLDD